MVHEIQEMGKGDLHKAVCTCKFSSGWVTKAKMQEWEDKHRRIAEQAMVHLRSRTPTLKNQFDYYMERYADPNETDENRRLWKQLADELSTRVPRPMPSGQEDALPFEVKYTRRRRGSRDDP